MIHLSPEKQRRILGLAKAAACLLAFPGLVILAGLVRDHGAIIFVPYFTLGLLLALGTADAIVNDLMPKQYSAPRAHKLKYLVFIGLGASQTPWLYAQALTGTPSLEFFGYLATIGACSGAALLDFRVFYANARP